MSLILPDVDGRAAEGVRVRRRGSGKVGGEGLLHARDVPTSQKHDPAHLMLEFSTKRQNEL